MSGVAKKIQNQTLETLLVLLLAKEKICGSKLGESRNKLMISTNLHSLPNKQRCLLLGFLPPQMIYLYVQMKYTPFFHLSFHQSLL